MIRATNLLGIHHITAIAGAPAENLRFYEKVLGLRLVKKTLNFDDPHTYHLYYGDDEGRPGTILTFFPWSGAAKGVNGAGMVTAISFSIAEAAVDHWLERLARQGITTKLEKRSGHDVIRFAGPHGLALELVSTDCVSARRTGERYGIESNFQISGFHPATSVVRESGTTDLVIPADRTEKLIQRLEDAGADLKVVSAAAGHQLTSFDVATSRQWLSKQFTVVHSG